jgi:uncharacterized membrane protein YedE/YeeE
MKTIVVNLFFGILFGWIISRAGVADYGHINGMFAFDDFHLFGVLGIAVPLAAIGFLFLKGKPTLAGGKLALTKKSIHPGTFPGGLIFGIGWALTGACPGTSIVQLGTGHWGALLTIAGITAGVSVYRLVHGKFFSWPMDTCG